MAEKIIFNGRVYPSPAEMPSDVRAAYYRINKFFKDANQDGVPDILQEGGLRGLKEVIDFAKEFSITGQEGRSVDQDQMTVIRLSGSQININGRQFNSLAEMPPDIRRTYENIISKVDPGEFDIFDEPWRETPRETYFAPHDDENLRDQPQSLTYGNPIEETTSNKFLVILLIAASVLLCLGGVVWLIVSNRQVPGL